MLIRVDNYSWIDPSEISQIWFRKTKTETLMCIELAGSSKVEISTDEDLSKSAEKVKYLIGAKNLANRFKVNPDDKLKVYFRKEKNPFVKDYWDNAFDFAEEYL